jgi:SH3 domain-containing YSC84-like protein 1
VKQEPLKVCFKKMTIHTPIPQGLAQESIKCAEIIDKFTKPEQGNLDKVIPPNVIAQAKGLAIMTVIKAGFVWSGRAGSGLVVSKLPDGSWSAPSAIGTAGMGFGGQIGANLTDFVIVLNTEEAVKAFSMGGNVTLGGNLSVSAGPMGRSLEASGSVRKFAPIYSYSKSKGLFAGVSIEGSVILERKDANAEFYGRKVSAKEILTGKVQPPAECEILYSSIKRQIELGNSVAQRNGPPAPVSSKYGLSTITNGINRTFTRPQQEENYSQQTSPVSPSNSQPPLYSTLSGGVTTQLQKRAPPLPPNRPPKPILARALYSFVGERESDLSFQEGAIIAVTRKTANENDWWSGKLQNKSGDVNNINLVSCQLRSVIIIPIQIKIHFAFITLRFTRIKIMYDAKVNSGRKKGLTDYYYRTKTQEWWLAEAYITTN